MLGRGCGGRWRSPELFCSSGEIEGRCRVGRGAGCVGGTKSDLRTRPPALEQLQRCSHLRVKICQIGFCRRYAPQVFRDQLSLLLQLANLVPWLGKQPLPSAELAGGLK